MSEVAGARRAEAERRAYDLVVAGGGLAGLCAAITAARQGLRVALVQDRPVLGGNSSSEVRVAVHGAGTYWPWAVETGVIAELIDEERYRNPEPIFEGSTSALWDIVLYEWAIHEKSLELFLHCSIRGVEVADAPAPAGSPIPGSLREPGRNRGRLIAAVLCSQLGNEKEFVLSAPLFVDATGDGTVAALAGAEWRMGREGRDEFGEPKAPARPDRVCQGSTIQFRARDLGRPVPFIAPDWAKVYPDEQSLYSRGHENPAGGYWWIEIGSPFDTLSDNEAIRHELVRHVLGVFDHLKNRGEHGAANLTLDWVGPVPGKRESRRVVGPVMLTENDLRRRRAWPDRLCHGGWFLDEHVPGGLLAADRKPEESAYDFDVKDRQQVGPYGIPLSALRSRDMGNLLLAGRDLSASHMALASVRVMGTCAVMGQAVGAAAAVCCRVDRRPGGLTPDDIAAVQQLLLKQDHYVPFVRNADPDDLARAATVTADSASPLRLERGAEDRWLDLTCATMQIVPITAGRLDAVSLYLDNRTGSDAELAMSVVRLNDIWDINRAVAGEEGMGTKLTPSFVPGDAEGAVVAARQTVPPGAGWASFRLDAAVASGLYGVVIDASSGVFWAQHPDVGTPPPGTAVASFRRSGLWRFEGLRGRWSARVMRLDPPSRPFEPGNVINGVARPEVWPNLWISDPESALPQTLTLRLARPADISEVRLTFDSNLGRNLRGTPGSFVDPHLVRDYRVELGLNGRWEPVIAERANRRRHRVHDFAARRADAARLVVESTNGMPQARVYEVRLYGPPGQQRPAARPS